MMIKENKNNARKITLFKCIDIQEKKIKDNSIFEGYEITKTINNIQEKAFLLKCSDKLKKVSDGFEIEDFIDNKEIKDIFIKHKGDKKTIENKLKDVPDWQQSISKSFNDYITSLNLILDIEQDKN